MTSVFHINRQGNISAGITMWVLIAATGLWACASLFFVTPAGAEPSPAVEYLMREPVSMLDWGLAQIEQDLFRKRDVLTGTKENLFDPEPSIRVDYAWEENRVQIFLKLLTCSYWCRRHHIQRIKMELLNTSSFNSPF